MDMTKYLKLEKIIKMENILLISNHIYHYRSKIYNYFYDEFLKMNYVFYVASNSIQNVNFELKYRYIDKKMNYRNYKRIIQEIQPTVVILFLHLKDYIMIPIINYCNKKNIKIIYWNHGINLRDPNNYIKNQLFYRIHDKVDAIITYSESMLKYFKSKNLEKIFIANNTLYLNDVQKKLPSKASIKNRYQIKEKYVILYVSRILEYKKPQLLINKFGGEKDIAVVFVGPIKIRGFLNEIERFDNIYYLGELYEDDVNEVYSIGDLFSTPGHIGLSLNQAFCWGLPVVVINGNHAPEITHLINNFNGLICRESEFYSEIINLFSNEDLLNKYSNNALLTFHKKLDIKFMFNGFIKAIDYCKSK